MAGSHMWGIITYEPVAAFGLRPSNTTANGGKSLVCPTPYAVKMALLDRLIRQYGEATVQVIFPVVRDLTLSIRVPLAVAVNRTFQKVQRLDNPSKGSVWKSTISQREFCIFAGDLTLAITLPDDADIRDRLRAAFTAINYFGRRGSFMQWANETLQVDRPADYIDLSRNAPSELRVGFLQRMDDMLPDASFEDVSVLNPKAKGGRISYTVTLPYKLSHHGANHTVYERIS
jgi:hypothetical protein